LKDVGPMRNDDRGLVFRTRTELPSHADGRVRIMLTEHPCPPSRDASIVQMFCDAVGSARRALILRDAGLDQEARAYWQQSAFLWLALGATENAGWSWQLATPHALSDNAVMQGQLHALASVQRDIEGLRIPLLAVLEQTSSHSS
jgi:hypothetical protein